MGSRQVELAGQIARMRGARAAWLVRATCPLDLLAKLGVIGPEDHLVAFTAACCGAVPDALTWGSVVTVDDPAPEAFLAQSGWGDPDYLARFSTCSDDGLAAQGSPASYAFGSGMSSARLFWFVDMLGAPGVRVPDIRALARAARSVGALLIVDCSRATSFACKPLALGAQVCLEAIGSDDAGCLNARRPKSYAVCIAPSSTGRGRKRLVHPEAEDAYRLFSFRLGDPAAAPSRSAALDGDELDRIASVLGTLPAAMQQRMDSARAIAAYLGCHPSVGYVWYPGIASHVDHGVATVTLEHGFGPVIDFCLTGAPLASCEGRARRLIELFESVRPKAADARPVSAVSCIKAGNLAYLRIYAGLDDPLEVTDSLDQALRLFCNPPQP